MPFFSITCLDAGAERADQGRETGLVPLGAKPHEAAMAVQHRFSPSAGWDEVVRIIRRELQLLLAIAGVFFLLPALVLGYFAPMPQETESLEQFLAAIQPNLPLMIAGGLVSMVGQLALWSLLLAPERTTVGEAIKAGILFLPYYFLISICVNVMLGIGFLLLILPGVYLWARLAALGPAAIGEQLRSPVAAIKRSFEVTQNNAFPIVAFMLIVLLVFLVIALVIPNVIGAILALSGMDMAPGGTGMVLMVTISALIQAAGTTVFAVMEFVIYRQLTGVPSPQVFG
jgi:hypothetical protein